MKTARILGTAFLAITLVLGLTMMFMPLGEAWATNDGVRHEQTLGMFTKTVDTGSALGPQTWAYLDVGLEGTGGITYLSVAGPVFAFAMFLTLTALILTAIPKAGKTVAGGLVAIPAGVLVVAAIFLWVLGARLHVYDLISTEAHVIWTRPAVALAFLTSVMPLVAGGMGVVRYRTGLVEESGWQTTVEHANTHGWVAGRNLRCPDCATVVTAGWSTVPICPTCEFGADYNGPAGRPVPARAVYAPATPEPVGEY